MSDASRPVAGVARSLALDRAQRISNVRYQLSLDIPAAGSISGRVSIAFVTSRPHVPLVLDFNPGPGHLLGISRAGRPCAYEEINGHIVVAPGGLTAGANTLDFAFRAGDAPLNRTAEFLYSLFVPARAHHTFPCFDQPDLKARFTLEIVVPPEWAAVSNAAETSRHETSDGRSRVRFTETLPISTYLFAFAAGRLAVEVDERDGRRFRILHRETDADLVARNRDAVFDLHAAALAWLEQYTDIPYPFGESGEDRDGTFDILLVPSFQFGGMEHPGAIYYNAASLLLGASATEHQQLARAHLIAHETAHLWFGDLVTMPWFDDVWMKEVFANLMAARIVNPQFPAVDHDLRFLVSHYPAAYSVDRTAGTHPIRQELGNLDDAGSLYGPIIYQKAPIVLQQLEELIGAEALQDGLRVYLRTYSYATAAWPELLRILDERADHDLEAWSQSWIEEAGRPLVPGSRRDVAIWFAGGDVVQDVLQDAIQDDRKAAARPTFPYGAIALDFESRSHLLAHIDQLPDPVARGAAWITLWEEVLDGRVRPVEFVDAAVRTIPGERVEQLVQLVSTYLHEAFWRFMPATVRDEWAPRVEAALAVRGSLQSDESHGSQTSPTLRATCFTAFRSLVTTPAGVGFLGRVWRREQTIPGLVLTEADEIAASLELAVRSAGAAQEILETQRRRIANPDRRARFDFVMPAASGDPAMRAVFFASLSDRVHRRREPWVAEGLRLLHHPLRAEESLAHLPASLDLLEEIQRTGDIFFPKQWMDAVLSGHRTSAAADIVRAFLSGHPDYPVRLRRVILQSADSLFRATRASST